MSVLHSWCQKKTPGDFRLIWDGRPINAYSKPTPFKYRTLSEVPNLLNPGDFMFSMDLEAGYYQISIHPDYRKYFTFMINGEALQYVGLPMGWSDSPYIFSRVMREFVSILRRRKPILDDSGEQSMVRHCRWIVKVLPYLDDFLFIVRTKRQGVGIGRYIKAVMKALGLAWSEGKSAWAPVQCIQHLGLIVDSVRGQFQVPAEKLRELKLLAKHLLSEVRRHKGYVKARLIARFTGKCIFVLPAIPVAKFFLRALHDCLRTKRSWNSSVKLSRQAIRDLQWWRKLPEKWNGGALWPPPHRSVLTADASDLGWSANLDNRLFAHGFWTAQDRSYHICVREFLAVLYGVQSFRPLVTGMTLRLRTDNTAVMYGLHNLASAVEGMMQVIRRLFWVMDAYSITLLPTYVPSAENTADELSRWSDHNDWMLAATYFHELEEHYGPHTIDRFASYTSHQLPVYNSLFHDPMTSGVDAFAQTDWEEHNITVTPLGICCPN